MSKGIGDKAELLACNYLKQQGLTLLFSNYRCRFGEIDLIMRDGNYLVFVEVRARKSSAFGGALASITASKQKRLIQTALHYQLTQNQQNQHPLRFDVVCLQGTPCQLEWIKNAFGLDY
ncbi:YraN family protein [Legionella taurinensis]|uniref:UPF0102 protein DB745_02575 n=1 Tax=Legionella taurinensis TaxID=70611 RepID=A0AB38N8H7_9GAMM|nr:YraN family protein [Legionella taurinensis]MDX1836243.1 YraN family protein [Legionella taurinensis]PUT41997.1 YraN family protein [Legionella taurinensis]PUT44784.1 YraN family protein [Legionella taurinensis]PUT48105.1 YraN family protein [Legionella taurinensis]PUT48919.1 YraN family protein [Legionella taurinensis]